VLYRMMKLSMTLTDPNPVLKVTAFLKSNISSYRRSYYGTLGTLTYGMVPCLVTDL